ncbi:Uncharacterized alpha/beta hydrolase domain [Duganella sp. CF458]|uniref:T6SS phospholipase effector Tle1-like catalytic domain-containing protein n=1 Tax=Duganella sp. CF458 TaxID=1884368 RepID=UPI0008E58282|nr:DUF2235 domain-containing protein [Duganella sp. CF458]SFF64193.1 Uncharacterized alpha/beta hydrolase domain [Duganella sp. CF458]
MMETNLFASAGPEPFLKRMNEFNAGSAKSTECEVALQFGLFFDGTDNNYERDKAVLGDSNIARLWKSYPRRPEEGISRLYVPGVGTRFAEIGAEAEGWRGTAFGIGCEARVLYALLKTLEFVRHFIDPQKPAFTKDQLNVLCQYNLVTSKAKEQTLLNMGLACGLQELGDDLGRRRQAYFFRETADLEKTSRRSAVRVKSIVIDIFGFSRGAAEARAYATWLCETLVSGRFAGIPLTIRFMGLLDTVASAGLVEMVTNALKKSTGGHTGWARPESLRIPSQAKNCVHFVAMHEFRKNFPVDSIFKGGADSPNFHEFAYPGSHSDVGGGYAPGDLGIAANIAAPLADAMKLSQIPLNHLYEYALAAGVPLSKDSARDKRSHYDPFAVSKELKSAFKSFLSINGADKRTLADWAKIYLAWRWHIRERYSEVGHVRRAKKDQHLLLWANRKLITDAERLLSKGGRSERVYAVKDMVYKAGPSVLDFVTPVAISDELEDEAGAVLKQAIASGMPGNGFTEFFDSYVHDSYAGFCADLKEPTGYWRYRKSFQGSDKPLNAGLDDGNAKDQRIA